VLAVALEFAGGAVPASLPDTLMPEAFEHGRPLNAFRDRGRLLPVVRAGRLTIRASCDAPHRKARRRQASLRAMTTHVVHTGARDGARCYRVEVALHEVGADVTAAMAAWTRERISPASRVVLRHRGGGIVVQVDAVWDGAAGDAVNIAWARACSADLARLAGAREDAGAAVR
jgi:hypothetical protein